MKPYPLSVSVGLIVMLCAGCGDGRTKFNLATTTGTVVCEGQPVPHAIVFFEPLQEGRNAVVGKQGIGFADEDGHFEISTYNAQDNPDGAVIGKHRVRVGAPSMEAFPSFKCDCSLNSEVDVTQVEVVSGQDNEFEIVLKKRAPNEPVARSVDEDD